MVLHFQYSEKHLADDFTVMFKISEFYCLWSIDLHQQKK